MRPHDRRRPRVTPSFPKLRDITVIETTADGVTEPQLGGSNYFMEWFENWIIIAAWFESRDFNSWFATMKLSFSPIYTVVQLDTKVNVRETL